MSPCYLRTIMASQAQIEANRRNSQKSTGPATDAGKAASALNALKTGIYAESLLIHGEIPETLDDLAHQYQATCRPVGPREEAVVNTLIHSDWLLRRMRRVESLLWNDKTEQNLRAKYKDYDPDVAPLTSWYCAEDHFLRIQRRLTTLDNAYHRALADLERLQAKRRTAPDPIPAEPPAAEIGFVPSPEAAGAQGTLPDSDSRRPAGIARSQYRSEMEQAPEIHRFTGVAAGRDSRFRHESTPDSIL
jgi:hypothetical protein